MIEVANRKQTRTYDPKGKTASALGFSSRVVIKFFITTAASEVSSKNPIEEKSFSKVGISWRRSDQYPPSCVIVLLINTFSSSSESSA